MPDERNFLRAWLVLSESLPYEGTDGATALDQKQIPGEGLLHLVTKDGAAPDGIEYRLTP